MKTLTELELKVMRAFIFESFDSCGDFSDEQNLSWMNANDLMANTGLNRHQVAALMGDLEKKGLIMDSGESARGARCNDYTAEPRVCAEYQALIDLIRRVRDGSE